MDFLPKLKLEIAVSEDLVDALLETIITATKSGKIGDGKLFVTPLEEAVRIRTGETGNAAV